MGIAAAVFITMDLFLILGIQLCFRSFSPKFKALFLESDYVLMIQSIVRR